MGTQPAGDADNSNLVSSTDFIIVKNSFGMSVGQPNYDPRADFDNSDIVTSVDFSLLKVNFGQAGCSPVFTEGAHTKPPGVALCGYSTN
jgi:hypothetical protein